jgi:O-6-methylguanine DNA methyltransferase
MRQTTIDTVDGSFLATFTSRGLASLDFPSAANAAAVLAPAAEIALWHHLTVQALEQALRGSPPGALPPFDLSAGSPFQRSVWAALQAIPPGRTRSYQEIARALNRPGGARAVGQACGANRIPVLIPCHRVLAANGRLGGFSGGLEWKIRLLQREGIGTVNTLELASLS